MCRLELYQGKGERRGSCWECRLEQRLGQCLGQCLGQGERSGFGGEKGPASARGREEEGGEKKRNCGTSPVLCRPAVRSLRIPPAPTLFSFARSTDEAARVWGSSEPQAPGTQTRPIGFRESVSHRAPPGALPTPLHLSEFGDHVCHDLFVFFFSWTAGRFGCEETEERRSGSTREMVRMHCVLLLHATGVHVVARACRRDPLCARAVGHPWRPADGNSRISFSNAFRRAVQSETGVPWNWLLYAKGVPVCRRRGRWFKFRTRACSARSVKALGRSRCG